MAWGWGGDGKFARAANSAAPHPAAVAPLSLRAARRDRPRPDGAARASRGRRAPRGDPRPRPRGVRRGAARASGGRGGRGRTGSGSAEGLDSPSAAALRGRCRGVGRRDGGRVSAAGIRPPGWGDRERFIHRVTFQAAVMSARNCKETPLSGPSQKAHTWGCPGLGGDSVTLCLEQVWGPPASRVPGWTRLPPAKAFPWKSWGEGGEGLLLWAPPGSFFSSPGHLESPVLPVQIWVSRGGGVQRRPGDFGHKWEALAPPLAAFTGEG